MDKVLNKEQNTHCIQFYDIMKNLNNDESP